jgi:hypothetical protein
MQERFWAGPGSLMSEMYSYKYYLRPGDLTPVPW